MFSYPQIFKHDTNEGGAPQIALRKNPFQKQFEFFIPKTDKHFFKDLTAQAPKVILKESP
jgi:hypothetical protein